MKKIYVTTPIYYINALPHIGHAYTTIACDVYSRYWKLRGKDVFFLTGTDEHGQKIADSAKAKNKQPKEFADNIVAKYKDLWTSLNIEYNKFIRTTDEEHTKTVQKVFDLIYKKGDIYKGEYKGWYCIPCETYFLETELIEKEKKICPDCGRELKIVSEEAYFFKLSKYQEKLLKYFDDNKEFLFPDFRAKEMINFIKDGLKDLCITRTAVTWGIPLPMDPKHSIYVWFDALINYISAIDFLDFVEGQKSKFEDIWPVDIHFVGKEIYKFHTIIWPAMLLSLGLPLPKKVFGHGWWTFEGEKMSKSKGNIVDPYKIVEEFGQDALRYFVLREVPFGNDGDFCMKNFIERYNGELANELGNLFSRALNMINKYLDARIPKIILEKNVLSDKSDEVIKEYCLAMENIDFSRALIKIWELIRLANKYIEDEAPWKIAKATNKEKLDKVLFNITATMRIIALLLMPFMPISSKKMLMQIGCSNFNNKDTESLQCSIPTTDKVFWNDMPMEIKIGELAALFPRKEI